jgi:nucleotide-binding universal stress UspA family protein
VSEQPKYSDTILAAIDGSAASKAAAEIAIAIARIDGMKISGLYVVDEVLILDRYTNYKWSNR